MWKWIKYMWFNFIFSWQFGMVLLNLLIKFYFLRCLCWNVIQVLQKKFGFYLKLFRITLGTSHGSCKGWYVACRLTKSLANAKSNCSLKTSYNQFYSKFLQENSCNILWWISWCCISYYLCYTSLCSLIVYVFAIQCGLCGSEMHQRMRKCCSSFDLKSSYIQHVGNVRIAVSLPWFGSVHWPTHIYSFI